MRKEFTLPVLVVLLILSVQVYGEGGPGVSGPPMMPTMNRGSRAFIVGPGDSMTAARPIRGKLVILASAPKEIQLSVVEIYVDGKSIGTANIRPYKIEYDTTTVSEGEHVVKAVGRDNAGSEVWAASAKVNVSNSAQPMETGKSDAPPPAPIMGAPITDTLKASNSIPAPKAQPMPVIKKPIVSSLALEQTYTNRRLGFSLKYPAGWTAKEETAALKSKTSDDFWVSFGTAPTLVNVHRKVLARKTTADTFAKYNPYVLNWQQGDVQGNPAFITSDGKPETKRVVHRVIFIKDGVAWMCNCIDTTGKPSAETAKLLRDMLETIQFTVKVTPIK